VLKELTKPKQSISILGVRSALELCSSQVQPSAWAAAWRSDGACIGMHPSRCPDGGPRLSCVAYTKHTICKHATKKTLRS
jgi:hypothetical protein